MRQALRSIYLWWAIGSFTILMYLAGAPIFLVTWAFDRKRAIPHWWAARWGRGVLKINSLWTPSVRYPERVLRDRPLVVIANHQGMGDIMMMYCLDLHFKWISKRNNFFVPFMGWFMFHAAYIPVKRGDKASVQACMEKARSWLTNGVSVLFFPEGTRSKDGEIQPFKPGAFKLALETGCDLLPVAISGTTDALPKHSWRFSTERSDMRMLVGHTIATKNYGKDELDRMMGDCHATLVTLKDELDGRPQQMRASA